MKKINCILLIDDNFADNIYNKIIIKEASVCNHISVAVDGNEAVEYLKKSTDPRYSDSFPKPDLIFLDINMPVMNGFEFLEEYRKLDEKMNVKIVMLTTSSHPDDIKKAKGYKEINEFENKPMTVETLQKIIENYF